MKRFLKKEPVLAAAAALAVISMFFVPPSVRYVSYMDFSVLGILFCLMLNVAGFRELGAFDFISSFLIVKSQSVRLLTILLVNCVFLTSMFVTNDVALIAFVPVTIGIFGLSGRDRLIFVIVMETMAANVGSMLTPIGNPQNLFLYSYYNMHILSFLKTVVPVGAAGYIIIMCAVLASKSSGIEVRLKQKIGLRDKKAMLIYYSCLFVLCVLSVLRLADYRICVPAALLSVAAVNRKLFRKVDYGLLITFVAFFVFAGNIERIGAVKDALSHFITGRAFVVSLIGSQAVSNVPAAMMISPFTKDAAGVLLGVDVGGLGTPVASLASLISLRLYTGSGGAPGRYMLAFAAYNAAALALLAAAAWMYLRLTGL
ncbi:MAG: SLC13 family permease [Firmicutes bacterium]|nr:SLC13 family permease [Bacillota bacterium]